MTNVGKNFVLELRRFIKDNENQLRKNLYKLLFKDENVVAIKLPSTKNKLFRKAILIEQTKNSSNAGLRMNSL